MHRSHRGARALVVVSVLCLLLAFFAYGGNEQSWMSDAIAVPLALVGVVGFAGATLIAALWRSSHRR